MSFVSSNPFRGRGLLGWAFVSAGIGLAALGFANHLARTLAAPTQLAGAIPEPETTGSIVAPRAASAAPGAHVIALDPAGRERLVVRGP